MLPLCCIEQQPEGEERIPADMLEIAKGVAFLTIAKVGMMFTARYGTGIVISRLSDGSWSCPSAITVSGFGWGLQFGGELTDVMLVLTTESAVEVFESRGQMSVGAELGVSVGPMDAVLNPISLQEIKGQLTLSATRTHKDCS